MADVITRLKVESNEYDNKLKRASQSLLSMQEAARRTGATMAIAEKEEVKFAQSLGNMQTVARNAKGKLGEMTNALTEMSIVYKRMTDEEKKGEFGRALNASIQQLTQRCKEAKAELADVTKSLGGANNSFSEFANGIGLNIGSLTKMGVAIGAAKMALDGLQAAVANNIETAMNFEYSMSKLQSLTGMAGDDLNTLKRKAIELGSSTTQSASQVADAFAIIGSKRPDLLSSAYALSDVTEAAIKMSEAAGMEVPEAADALAAALNIFQLQSDQATRVINVLAAGSKLGAAGIQELGEMTFRAGGSAKKAGLSFEEFAAAAEIIRPAFGSAEDAGQALNKFLSKLEEKMTNNYKPSVVGFQQAMVNLKNANLDSNESLKIFTSNGVKAYDAIMANVDGLEKMTKGVTGTNTALEQADINTNNLRGSMANLSSAREGFNLAMNDSNGILKSMVDWLTQTVTWATNTFTELGRIKKKMDEINEAAGGGGKSRVDREMSAFNGSIYKADAQRGIGHQYDLEIEEYQKKINKMQRDIETATRKGGGQAVASMRKQIQEWQESIKALQNSKNEFYARSNAAMAKPTTPSGNGDGGGGGGGSATVDTSHTGTHKKTPAEQAAERVANAQLDYAQTIEKADIRMKAGLDDTLAHKKKELSAQERLFDAYSDAYAIYADPKYKAMLDESATAIGKLAEEVKGLDDYAAKVKEAESAFKKGGKATVTVDLDTDELDKLKEKLPPESITSTVEIKTEGELPVIEPQNVTDVVTIKTEGEQPVLEPQSVTDVVTIKTEGDPPVIEPQNVTSTVSIDVHNAEQLDELNKYLKSIGKEPISIDIVPNVKMETGISGFKATSIDYLTKQIKDDLANTDFGTPLYNSLRNQLADITALNNLINTSFKNGLKIDSSAFEGLWENIGDGIDIPDSAWQTIANDINKKLKELGISPIKINFETGDVNNANKTTENKKESITDSAYYKGSSELLSGLKGMTNGIEKLGVKIPEGLKKGFEIFDGVMSIIQAIQTITNAINIFSSANGATQTALLTGIEANTAITAAGSWLPWSNGGFTHAANGVITGSHFSGDVQPLMVNAGEGVINQADQANLWRAIKDGNFGGGGSIQSVGVRGTDLLLCLNNELRSQGKPTL